MTILLIKGDDLVTNTIIGGNSDTDKYWPAVKTYQLTVLKPLLGKPLYTKLCNDFESDTLYGVYLELYNDYVKEMVIHGSAEIYLASAAYMVTNNGITKGKTETSESVSKEEVDYLVQNSRKLHNTYELHLLEWMKDNGSSLPELTFPQEVNNNAKTYVVGGWLLSRNKGC